MIIDKLQVLIEAIFKGTGFRQLDAQIMGLKKASQLTGVSINNLKNSAKRMNVVVSDAGEEGVTIMNKFTGQVTAGGKALDVLSRNAVPRFRMELLSIMFGMAMLNRYTMLLLRSMITTWTKAYSETEGFTRATDRLLAAWTYLKWSIIDALTQSELFQNMIRWITQLVDWFGNLDEKTKAAIGWGLIFVAFTTAILGTLAALGLLMNGLKMFLESLGLIKIAMTILNTGGIGALIISILKFAGVIGSIILIVWGLIDVFRFWGKDVEKVMWGIVKIAAGVGTALLLIFGLSNPVGWVMIAIAGVVAIGVAVYKNWEKIKQWSINIFSAIGGFFKTWFYDKPKEWIDALIGWINNAINKVRNLIDKLNPITGIKKLLGSKQMGGYIGTTGPYMLHAGEYVVPKTGAITNNKTANFSFNPIYNVTVADKNELKRMFNEMMANMITQLKREINVSGY